MIKNKYYSNFILLLEQTIYQLLYNITILTAVPIKASMLKKINSIGILTVNQ